ncbi:MAG: hypothetical protein QXO63_00285 [Thermoplasmatales archaeon]
MIILADAELELVPDEILNEDDVKSIVEKEGRKNILLENCKMRRSIEKFFPKSSNRIGFPDIAYMFYRMNEESAVMREMNIGYAIHTKMNIVIEDKDLRGIGPSYFEFKERVEEILSENHKKISLMEYLKSKGIEKNTVVLHPKGRRPLPRKTGISYVIGGFPQGDFVSNISYLDLFSIHEEELTVPAVLELLHFNLFLSSDYP